MPEKLDKDRLHVLLEDADTKWFQNHAGPFNYREHLEFISDYISKNYNKGKKKKEAST